MIFGVSFEVLGLLFMAAAVNAVVAVFISGMHDKAAYKRGYNAGLAVTEAIALGRMMEEAKHRHRAAELMAPEKEIDEWPTTSTSSSTTTATRSSRTDESSSTS